MSNSPSGKGMLHPGEAAHDQYVNSEAVLIRLNPKDKELRPRVLNHAARLLGLDLTGFISEDAAVGGVKAGLVEGCLSNGLHVQFGESERWVLTWRPD